jgi:long-chain acyl-CoA synthetase
MSAVLYAINKWSRLQPEAPAVTGMNISLNYQQLYEAVCKVLDYLEAQRPSVLGVMMDNSPAWVVIDLAAQAANIPLLPLPGFFSEQQIQHAITDAGCDCILTDQAGRFDFLGYSIKRTQDQLSALHDRQDVVHEFRPGLTVHSRLNKSIAKVTYTSGTTDSPKGVCLPQSVIDTVAQSLCHTVEMHGQDRHFCALPLATLLENIAGIYVPLLAGAQTTVYPMEKVGLRGTTGFDACQFQRMLCETQATTTVLVPHLLQQLVEACEQSQADVSSLRFIALGGAPVSPELLERAQQCQLPVFEGYGLSECSSVVAVNNPHAHRPGSVGKPLPHVELKFAEDGEILVKGVRFTGYLGERIDSSDFYATGDMGYLDEDGYLYLSGRKKNIFITAFGRNVSPEWVERELVLHEAIEQAAIFGEARPWNVAVIVPALNSSDFEVTNAIKAINQKLPDYARIKTWITANESFQVSNQLLTATGRLRRQEIWHRYAGQVEQLYLTNLNSYRKTA